MAVYNTYRIRGEHFGKDNIGGDMEATLEKKKGLNSEDLTIAFL